MADLESQGTHNLEATGAPHARLLTDLRRRLTERSGTPVFPCIEDLVLNGLDRARAKTEPFPPDRQSVTQYVAAWCRFVGLDHDSCLEWLTDYAITVLSAISRRTPAAIRHSTKGNVRYIYLAEVPFVCGREENPFGARCSDTCPAYLEMAGKPCPPWPGGWLPGQRPLPPPPPPPAHTVPVKERFKGEFAAAIALIKEELANGTKTKTILAMLQERNMKTRTGRPWSSGSLSQQVARLRPKRSKIPGLQFPPDPQQPNP